jgi:hypothetical protein
MLFLSLSFSRAPGSRQHAEPQYHSCTAHSGIIARSRFQREIFFKHFTIGTRTYATLVHSKPCRAAPAAPTTSEAKVEEVASKSPRRRAKPTLPRKLRLSEVCHCVCVCMCVWCVYMCVHRPTMPLTHYPRDSARGPGGEQGVSTGCVF